MSSSTQKAKLIVLELVLLAVFGALIFCGDILMEAFPNIHLAGVLIVTCTVIFRAKALYSVYIYVGLTLVLNGFSLWSLPYLYIWLVLWGMTMLVPKKLPIAAQYIVYPIICGLHGLMFGALYAPGQALMFGFNFEETVAWIMAGLPFDIIHAVGNLVGGIIIIVPASHFVKKLLKTVHV